MTEQFNMIEFAKNLADDIDNSNSIYYFTPVNQIDIDGCKNHYLDFGWELHEHKGDKNPLLVFGNTKRFCQFLELMCLSGLKTIIIKRRELILRASSMESLLEELLPYVRHSWHGAIVECIIRELDYLSSSHKKIIFLKEIYKEYSLMVNYP